MEIVRIQPSPGQEDRLTRFTFQPCVLALGAFDGVHKGHQALIAEAQKIARNNGLICGVMTFDPNPKAFLFPSRENVKALTPLPAKAAILQQLGVDVLIVVEFNHAFSRLSPERFVDQYLLGLHCRHAVVGFDFRYGYQGRGHAQKLAREAKGRMAVTIVEPVVCGREKISSTAIRRRLLAGDVASIAHSLGRPYEVPGHVNVLHGPSGKAARQKGPIQIVVPDDVLLPKRGDYVVVVETNEGAFLGRGRVIQSETPLVQFESWAEGPADDWHKKPVTVRWLRPIPGVYRAKISAQYVFEQS